MKGKFFVTALMTGMSFILISCAAPFPNTNDKDEDVELDVETLDETLEETSEGSLENNGNFFVKVDNKIYFHAPSKENMDKASLFGSFAADDYGNNELMSYDYTTGKTTKIGEETTFGNIFVMNGKLYTNCFQKADSDMKVKAISFDISDGYKQSFIKSDNINAVDEDGNTLVTSVYSDGGTKLSIYTSDGNQYTIENVTECVDCKGDKVFYISSPEHMGDEKRLCEYDISEDKSTFLGCLPESENVGDYYKFSHFTVDEEHNNVFFSFVFYSGATKELTGVNFMTATLGKENSLSCERTRLLNLNNQNAIDPTAFTVGGDGKMDSSVKGSPFFATYDRAGHVVWYDENCEKHVVESSNKHGRIIDVDGIVSEDPEIMEYIDGKVYIVRNTLERDEDNDKGMHVAYKRKDVRVYAIDVNTGEETEIFNTSKEQ